MHNVYVLSCCASQPHITCLHQCIIFEQSYTAQRSCTRQLIRGFQHQPSINNLHTVASRSNMLCVTCDDFLSAKWIRSTNIARQSFYHHKSFESLKNAAKIIECRLCINLWKGLCRRKGWRMMTQSDYSCSSLDFHIIFTIPLEGYGSDLSVPNYGGIELSFTVVEDDAEGDLLMLRLMPAECVSIVTI